MNVDGKINCGWSSDENVYKDPVSILNTFRNKYYADGNSTENGIIANALNDILPRMIVPPCKVGDTVYRISKRYGEWCVLPRAVCSIRYSLDSRGNIAWYLFTTTEDRIGKTVFLTREEAEQALKGEHHAEIH